MLTIDVCIDLTLEEGIQLYLYYLLSVPLKPGFSLNLGVRVGIVFFGVNWKPANSKAPVSALPRLSAGIASVHQACYIGQRLQILLFEIAKGCKILQCPIM